MLKIGFAKEIITPQRGVALCGYFNPRPNVGSYDDICVKALVMELNGVKSAILSYDLCFVGLQLVADLKKALQDASVDFTERIVFAATHSHTAPYSKRFFGADPDPSFLSGLIAKTVSALKNAEANLYPAEMLTTSTRCDTLAFNRRYWMKNGTVLTNPGKLNPDIVKPEGPVDYEIPVLAFKQDGVISLILANIVNHTDTIGGETVSADWPGRMERCIQNELGYDVPVMTLIGCSGNINHFDTKWDDPQTSYEEAKRIGKGYAEVILNALKELKPLAADSLRVESSKIQVPFSVISDEDYAKAEAILQRVGNASSDKNLTSEGLASGDGPVAKFFAEQLIAYRHSCSGKTREFTLLSMKFGKELGIVTLPGEPFTEIGLGIKKNSPFATTIVIALAMGAVGYVPMPECFERGGYEILPVEDGNPQHDTALRLIEAGSELISR